MPEVKSDATNGEQKERGNYDTLFNLYVRRHKQAVNFPSGEQIIAGLKDAAEKAGYVWRQVPTTVAGYVSYVVETQESAKTAGKASAASRLKTIAAELGMSEEEALAKLESLKTQPATKPQPRR